jgi:hypothetical protein
LATTRDENGSECAKFILGDDLLSDCVSAIWIIEFSKDAAAGELLWRFQTGGSMKANPISYLSGGKQQVAIASGNSIFVFGLPGKG